MRNCGGVGVSPHSRIRILLIHSDLAEVTPQPPLSRGQPTHLRRVTTPPAQRTPPVSPMWGPGAAFALPGEWAITVKDRGPGHMPARWLGAGLQNRQRRSDSSRVCDRHSPRKEGPPWNASGTPSTPAGTTTTWQATPRAPPSTDGPQTAPSGTHNPHTLGAREPGPHTAHRPTSRPAGDEPPGHTPRARAGQVPPRAGSNTHRGRHAPWTKQTSSSSKT